MLTHNDGYVQCVAAVWRTLYFIKYSLDHAPYVDMVMHQDVMVMCNVLLMCGEHSS